LGLNKMCVTILLFAHPAAELQLWWGSTASSSVADMEVHTTY